MGEPDPASPTLVAMVVLVAIGMIGGVLLLVVGRSAGDILAIETPLVLGALAVLYRRLEHIETKVNGQLDQARIGAYSAGYAHGAQGLPPKHDVDPVDIEQAVITRAQRRTRRAPPGP